MSIKIRTGYDQMNFEEVTSMLGNTYWSPGIGKAEVMQGARHSALLVGAFDQENKQVGYARVISDRTRFAYIMDVVVHETCRRQGIGQTMVSYILHHEDLKDVYQWLLITSDAHGVYRRQGFSPVATPGDWMEIRHPRPER